MACLVEYMDVGAQVYFGEAGVCVACFVEYMDVGAQV